MKKIPDGHVRRMKYLQILFTKDLEGDASVLCTMNIYKRMDSVDLDVTASEFTRLSMSGTLRSTAKAPKALEAKVQGAAKPAMSMLQHFASMGQTLGIRAKTLMAIAKKLKEDWGQL